MGEVAVIGSLNLDLVVSVEACPEPGETVESTDLLLTEGGKGANQAVACSRAGARVGMAGCIGQDEFGVRLIRSLERAGISTAQIRAVNSPTGMAFIWVERDGANRIVLSRGANARVKTSMISEWIRSMDRVRCLLLQLEIPLEAVKKALVEARERDVTAILDPAPAPPGGLPADVLERVGVLTPNAREAEILTGLPVKNLDQAAEAAQALRSRGPSAVVVTVGKQGCVLVSGDSVKAFPAFRVRSRDETAAGDAFNGYLGAGLAQGLGLEEAIRRASAAGALASTLLGAQPSIPRLQDVKRFMEERTDDGWPMSLLGG